MRAVGIRKPVSSGRLRRSSFRISHIRPSMTPKASAASKLTRLHTITMNAGPFFRQAANLACKELPKRCMRPRQLNEVKADLKGSEGRSEG
jgi:hypothetical protein